MISIHPAIYICPCGCVGASPYESIQVADVGDIYFNMFDVKQACADIKSAFSKLIGEGCRPLAAGGDHTITYPILQAFKVPYTSKSNRKIYLHVMLSVALFKEKKQPYYYNFVPLFINNHCSQKKCYPCCHVSQYCISEHNK